MSEDLSQQTALMQHGPSITGNLTFYNISTKSLLEQFTTIGLEQEEIYEKAVEHLIQLVKVGTIWFPYQKYYRGNPDELFINLKNIDLESKQGPYRLHSYYPLAGSYLPPKFRGVPIIIIGSRDTYELADVLSDHFIEDVRLKAKRYDQNWSISECWEIDTCLKEIMKTVLRKKYITPATLRDAIYQTTPETRIFNPTWAKALLKLVIGNNLAGLKWLDISAGWGDRLLTAMALDMEYTGFDPNIQLQPGHSAMIERFGNANIHRVIYEPFETAQIPGGPYDVILSSPPYFTIEEYAPKQQGQSIVSYPDFNQWMVWFLFVALEKVWTNLKDNGCLILHLGDAKTIATAEAANMFIENYLPGASWEGVIGLQGEAGFPRPVWVWKKLIGTGRTIWEPQDRYVQGAQKVLLSHQRTLYHVYYPIQAELIRYYANKYTPYYLIRRSSASSVRDHISIRLPHIPSHIIDNFLKEDLIISSLLEVLSPEKTIDLLTTLIDKHAYQNPVESIESLENVESNWNLTMDDIYSAIKPIAPYFLVRKYNAENIRRHVISHLPTVNCDLINDILQDDLLISSLIETLESDRTVSWAVAMVKLALRI